MLLMEAEAALGDDGGEVLLGSQAKVGDGEREGERLLVGLLTGLCFGDKACSIRLLLSWNICFWRQERMGINQLSKSRRRAMTPKHRLALQFMSEMVLGEQLSAILWQ